MGVPGARAPRKLDNFIFFWRWRREGVQATPGSATEISTIKSTRSYDTTVMKLVNFEEVSCNTQAVHQASIINSRVNEYNIFFLRSAYKFQELSHFMNMPQESYNTLTFQMIEIKINLFR